MKRFDVWTCTQTWINHFQECILHAMLISEYRNCENLMNVLAWNVYNNASFHKCFTSYQFFWKAKVFPFDLNRSSCTVFQTSTFHMCKYFVPHFCDAWHENYFGQQQKHGKKTPKIPTNYFRAWSGPKREKSGSDDGDPAAQIPFKTLFSKIALKLFAVSGMRQIKDLQQ